MTTLVSRTAATLAAEARESAARTQAYATKVRDARDDGGRPERGAHRRRRADAGDDAGVRERRKKHRQLEVRDRRRVADPLLVDQRVPGDAAGDRDAEREADAVRVDRGRGRAGSRGRRERLRPPVARWWRARARPRRRRARAPARRRARSDTRRRAAPGGMPWRGARSTRARAAHSRGATATPPRSTCHTTTATGANTSTAVSSATTVAASTSGARASSRFQSAWKTAAASANASAVAGMCRRYPRGQMQALVFDFNGTLSDDEPVLFRVYQELFAEVGRPITERRVLRAPRRPHRARDAHALARATPTPPLIAERIRRYNELVADGSTVDAETRAAVRSRRRGRASGSSRARSGSRSSPCSRRRACARCSR